MLDCEIAQHEQQKLNDELQVNQQKVKHLESNITKLYLTAEIWKKGNRYIVIVIQYGSVVQKRMIIVLIIVRV